MASNKLEGVLGEFGTWRAWRESESVMLNRGRYGIE